MRQVMAMGALLCAAALSAQPVGAATFYKLATAKDLAFIVDPTGITAAPAGGGKTAKIYIVRTSQTMEIQEDEFDCLNDKLRTRARTISRTDLSPLRAAKFDGAWRSVDANSTGDRAMKFACGWPQTPAFAVALEGATLAAVLRDAADDLRAHPNASAPALIIDKTSVGDCIAASIPREVASKALANVVQFGGMAPLARDKAFREAVGEVAPKCTGRAPSEQDNSIVGAALSIFTRYGLIGKLRLVATALTQDQFDAVWNTADPATRAPFARIAGRMIADGTLPKAANRRETDAAINTLLKSPDIKATMDAQKRIGVAERRILLFEYFSATAIAELSEATLAQGSSAN